MNPDRCPRCHSCFACACYVPERLEPGLPVLAPCGPPRRRTRGGWGITLLRRGVVEALRPGDRVTVRFANRDGTFDRRTVSRLSLREVAPPASERAERGARRVGA
jgi:hypothetical protein